MRDRRLAQLQAAADSGRQETGRGRRAESGREAAGRRVTTGGQATGTNAQRPAGGARPAAHRQLTHLICIAPPRAGGWKPPPRAEAPAEEPPPAEEVAATGKRPYDDDSCSVSSTSSDESEEDEEEARKRRKKEKKEKVRAHPARALLAVLTGLLKNTPRAPAHQKKAKKKKAKKKHKKQRHKDRDKAPASSAAPDSRLDPVDWMAQRLAKQYAKEERKAAKKQAALSASHASGSGISDLRAKWGGGDMSKVREPLNMCHSGAPLLGPLRPAILFATAFVLVVGSVLVFVFCSRRTFFAYFVVFVFFFAHRADNTCVRGGRARRVANTKAHRQLQSAGALETATRAEAACRDDERHPD